MSESTLPESTSPKKSRSLWLTATLLIAVAVVGYAGWRWATAEPEYVVQAQLLVTKKEGFQGLPVQHDPRGYMVDDFMSTHLVLLRSPTIISYAVDKRKLSALKLFEDTNDPVGKIQKMLRVTRGGAGGSSSNIILLECRGPIWEDCAKVLRAVEESYQDFLDLTDKNSSDNQLDLVLNARKTLKTELAEAEERYRKFRKDQEETSLDKAAAAHNYETLNQKLLEAQLRFFEIEQQIFRTDRNPDSLETNLSARQWAKASGFDALPEELRKSKTVVAAYQDHLREERELAASRESSIRRLMNKQTAVMNRIQQFELQESQLRGDVERTKALLDATLKRLSELNLARDSSGFVVRELSPPALVR